MGRQGTGERLVVAQGDQPRSSGHPRPCLSCPETSGTRAGPRHHPPPRRLPMGARAPDSWGTPLPPDVQLPLQLALAPPRGCQDPPCPGQPSRSCLSLGRRGRGPDCLTQGITSPASLPTRRNAEGATSYHPAGLMGRVRPVGSQSSGAGLPPRAQGAPAHGMRFNGAPLQRAGPPLR